MVWCSHRLHYSKSVNLCAQTQAWSDVEDIMLNTATKKKLVCKNYLYAVKLKAVVWDLAILIFGIPTNIYLTYLSQILPRLSSGFAAGTYYTSPGGGANYQCMPLDPEYNEYAPGGGNAVLSGAEYQTESILKSVLGHNVPCARCYTHNSAVMIIPGKRSCPPNWKAEYEGK